jgi:multidrug resistance efflux pump
LTEERTKLALSEEVLRRNRNLYAKNVLRENDVTDSELLVAYEKGQIAVAEAEATLEAARLDDLFLRSPIDGIVYKFDVRLGETRSPGDNTKIVLGSPKRQERFDTKYQEVVLELDTGGLPAPQIGFSVMAELRR